jgi:nicotinate dehydrogenase subunit A
VPTYRCRVNRRAVEIASADPQQPLLYALRGSLGLTGAKIGCGLGQCGSCTVLVDNAPVRSCVTPVASIAGKQILTIEGLGSVATPDRVQAAFAAEHAAQCGYCTPGMVMSATALLARNSRPTVPEIKDALAGNLCRCGAYTRILRAVLRASGQVK